jgi:hypothetical protein
MEVHWIPCGLVSFSTFRIFQFRTVRVSEQWYFLKAACSDAYGAPTLKGKSFTQK